MIVWIPFLDSILSIKCDLPSSFELYTKSIHAWSKATGSVDDSIPISADPIKEHPVVDNKRFSEWVENMASAMAEMSKKYE